jgi:cutinase
LGLMREVRARMVEESIRLCPDAKIVVSGYSQGAQLVHNSMLLLEDSMLNAVSSVVLFGDPSILFPPLRFLIVDENMLINCPNCMIDFSTPVPRILVERQKVFCHKKDDICGGGCFVFDAHTNYKKDANEAASFVLDHAGIAISNEAVEK